MSELDKLNQSMPPGLYAMTPEQFLGQEPVEAKTVLGKRLQELRDQAIANGMTLLSPEEIECKKRGCEDCDLAAQLAQVKRERDWLITLHLSGETCPNEIGCIDHDLSDLFGEEPTCRGCLIEAAREATGGK